MIQKGNAQELSALAEPLGEHAIFLAGRRITGWMVMRTDTGSRIHEDQGLKDFPRMHDGQGQGANRDDINADDAVFRIKPAHEELLAIQAFKTGPEQGRGGKGGLNGSR